MNLHQCEKIFTDALRPGASEEVFSNACSMLVQQGSLPPQQRLLIYRHNISGGFINALSATFVVCRQVLGQACFSTMARDYAWNRVHQSGDLNELGRDFPDYLQAEIDIRIEFVDVAYLADLARLEWFIEQSAQADDSGSVNMIGVNMVEHSETAGLYPVMNPSLRLLATDYPVLEIWQAHRQPGGVSHIQGLDERAYLCVCRDRYDDVIIKLISKELFSFMSAMVEGASLEHLVSIAASEAPQIIHYAMQQEWLQGFKN